MTESAALHQRLLDDLVASGKLTPPWREAFAALPRHQFIPDTIWEGSGGKLVPLRRTDDPDRWLDAAYALDAVITQVDDGHPAGPGDRGRYITSSASQPDVVALMLAALDAQPGMRVLEIGTATGYNAALLAHRLGTQNVTSVEIDPDLAEHARTTLAATGYPVTVITGDGAQGHPPHAPYDRVIATAAVHQLPYPWVAQTRPGGKILTPWGTHYHNGALTSFTVNADGSADHYPDHYARLWFVDPLTDSWANLIHQPHTPTYPVHQSGPRNLWDDIECAYHWWLDAGRPGPQRWRITITPEGQHVTLTDTSAAADAAP